MFCVVETRHERAERGDAMSAFSEKEIEYLGSQLPGRLATVGRDGVPQVVPVSFRYNPDTDTIDIGGHDFARKRSTAMSSAPASLRSSSMTCCPPWRPRAVEIRGDAAAVESGGRAIMSQFDDEIIRITPRWVISWGLDNMDARPSS
jgi:pyridoxamine 5'-phosphate oxidase family protein